MNIPGGPADPRTPARAPRAVYFPSLDSPLKYMTPEELRSFYGPPVSRDTSDQARPAIQPDLDTESRYGTPGELVTRPTSRRRVEREKENVQIGSEDAVGQAARPGARKRLLEPGTCRSSPQVHGESRDVDSEADDDADDEEAEKPRKRVRRSKKKGQKKRGEEEKVLSGIADELSTKQKTVRRDLKGFIRVALIEVTGYGTNTTDTPSTIISSVTYTPFDLSDLVTSPINSKIITKVAKLVCKEQRDPILSSLTYKHAEVDWTKRDLEEFAKSQFRWWRTNFQASISEDKAAKAQLRKRLNKRDIRRTHYYSDRLAAVGEYKRRHGADPTPFLDEAYMSDQVSAIETDDEEKATAYVRNLQEKAGFSQQDIAEGRPVWEMNRVLTELDIIRAEDRKKSKKKTGRARPIPPFHHVETSRRYPTAIFPDGTDLGSAAFLSGGFMPNDPSIYFVNEGSFRRNTEFVLKPHGIHIVLGEVTAFERDYAMFRSFFKEPFNGTQFMLLLIVPYRLGFLSQFDMDTFDADHTRTCLAQLNLPLIVQVDSCVVTEHEDSDSSDSNSELSEETNITDPEDVTCVTVGARSTGSSFPGMFTSSVLGFAGEAGNTFRRQMRVPSDQVFGVGQFMEEYNFDRFRLAFVWVMPAMLDVLDSANRLQSFADYSASSLTHRRPPSCPPILPIPWHEAPILFGGFLPDDSNTFYVFFGSATGSTSFFLPSLHQFVVLGRVLWVASNYAVYSASTEFRAGAVPSTFSINLLIPYYVGSPIVNLAEYRDWVCSSTLEIRLRDKWSLRSSLISDWSTGPFSTHFPWETPPVDEDQEFDRILAAVRSEDESLWVPFSAPALEGEVEDMRRVDLARVDNSIPQVEVYQSMVDHDWFKAEVAGKGLEDELLIFNEASGLTEDDEDEEEGGSGDDLQLPPSSDFDPEGTPALQFPASDEEEA
ncbi:hypothetical protein HWV62_26672 [Athelia sp. TMB]|nr:hypothetical protein HWV62_26672 [Athelia sp. TMB]